MMTPSSSPRPRGFSSMSPSSTKMNEAGTDSGGGKQNFYSPMWEKKETGTNSHVVQGQSGQVPNGFAPIDPKTIQTVTLDQLIRNNQI